MYPQDITLMLFTLGYPREMLSKGVLERGNWQCWAAPCCQPRKGAEGRRFLCTVPSPIIQMEPERITLDINRMGRKRWIRGSWDLQISQQVLPFHQRSLSNFYWHAKCLQWPTQTWRRRHSMLNVPFLWTLLPALESTIWPSTNYFMLWHTYAYLFYAEIH